MLTVLAASETTPGITGYTTRELRRIFREHRGLELPAVATLFGALPRGQDAIVLGTAADNPAAAALVADGFLSAPASPQGYAMRCAPHPADPQHGLLAIVGTDAAGALYALRDLEHYELSHLRFENGRFAAEPFTRCDYPRLQYRGHWTWGCNLPDKPAWIENLSRWKLNELIHWDNFPPADARQYVAFAHERGVRIVWGFGWGWVPAWNFTLPLEFDHGTGQGVEMCASSEFNRAFFRREIRRKIREDYAPTGCDGVYFQAFTECPKCQCPRCAQRTMGELMLAFVNPIVADIKAEFPGLWVSCGIHHDFGDFAYLKDLDPRCNIYWENCVSGTSVRGDGEDFGYIYKSIPYGHGYSQTCPADPLYTEASLAEWMQGNAGAYTVAGGLADHCQYLRFLQDWGRRFLGKPSAARHASVVADHSVFCRRTPFPHVALAEAQWNPDLDTAATVDGILRFLGTYETVARTPDSGRRRRDPGGKPPWLCGPDDATGEAVAREGHTA